MVEGTLNTEHTKWCHEWKFDTSTRCNSPCQLLDVIPFCTLKLSQSLLGDLTLNVVCFPSSSETTAKCS